MMIFLVSESESELEQSDSRRDIDFHAKRLMKSKNGNLITKVVREDLPARFVISGIGVSMSVTCTSLVTRD